ncbi:MAG TPA: hypothetical protein PKB02_17670 [Anaerohalosphaeraceae bacterium]|nr:hypothetical protein [Anaerohalosphaeraceae bacterium]
MAISTHIVIRQTDKDIISNLVAICSDFKINGHIHINTELANMKYSPNDLITNKEYDSIKQDNFSIKSISFRNSEPNGNTKNFIPHITYDRKDHYDNITIELNNNDFLYSIYTLNTLQRYFTFYNPVQNLKETIGPALGELFSTREQALLRLEGLSQRLIEENEAYRRKLDAEYAKKETVLNQKFDEAQSELTKQEDQLLKKHDERKKALDEREKRIDDRDNCHVRRDLRNDIKKELKERSIKFTLTPSTTQKRWPVHGVFVILLTFLLSMIILLLEKATGNTDTSKGTVFNNIFPIIELSILTISFIVTSIFYIKWIDRWAQLHADEEFRLKRLELDIDRASWIVEMALEWKEATAAGVEIPRELLDTLSRNLFSDRNSVTPTEHPYEKIAKTLLNVSAEAKIPIPGGGELRIDKKGLKTLSKEASD